MYEHSLQVGAADAVTTVIPMLVVGLVIGGGAVWLILKAKIQSATEKAKGEGEAGRASLTATLQARDSQIQDLNTTVAQLHSENSRLQGQLTTTSARLAAAEEKNTLIPTLNGSLDRLKQDILRLQTELSAEAAKRAAAEEKNTRIPALEGELHAKLEVIDGLNSQVSSLSATQAELNTLVKKERIAADEKLALLNDAQNKLGDAFKALSSDALKSNNQTFLELAKTSLEAFQQGAQTDLSARTKAIDELNHRSQRMNMVGVRPRIHPEQRQGTLPFGLNG